ncbi:MAG: sulfite exporter TauE/SafE family protein [Ignavibacteriae bacterium]|nr:sulfite exporter TauE/SafE family protein [Ignavibacteriota bacterium]
MFPLDSLSLLFILTLFIAAFLYASVGHGGASGYLALMGLYHIAPETMKPSALLMNIAVSIIAFGQYSLTNSLNKKLFILLIAGSIPAAYFGALITLDATIYKRILAVILLVPIVRLVGFSAKERTILHKPNEVLAVFIGIIIGFLSGMIGIGGGILLSPLILLLGWTDIKQASLISSLFIFLNSISGMAGILSKGITLNPMIYTWIAVAVAGGTAGAYLGSRRFNNATLRVMLGLVLLVASIKLFLSV